MDQVQMMRSSLRMVLALALALLLLVHALLLLAPHAATAAATATATSTLAPLPYEHVRGTPYTVAYDHRAILINNQRVFLQSGSIHYPRSTPSMWPGLFNLTKAAGLNAVQVYVFWNDHEAEQGVYDFETFNHNLPAFLQLIADAGLFVNLRIGPYVCAEWDWGGLPAWVHAEHMVVRSMDPKWLAVMQTWVTTVANLIEPFLARNGGPIILAQIENEYGNIESAHPDGPAYVEWCGNLTRTLNLSIPWVMCVQPDAPADIINTCNGYYCDNFIAGHQVRQQPSMWTEDWSGWFYHWGEAKIERPAQDLAFAVARWVARGGTFHNYYMWHGGTTFGRHAGGPNIVTSYSYDAPLDDYGVPRANKYPHVAALHQTLNRYVSALLDNDIPSPGTPCGECEIHVYGTASSSGVAFLSNWNDTTAFNMTLVVNADEASATFEVPAWTVFIVDLASLSLVYRTDDLSWSSSPSSSMRDVSSMLDAPREPRVFDSPIADLAYFAEPVGLYDTSKVISAARPLEQIDTTMDTSDYLWYVTYVTLSPAQISAGRVELNMTNCGDIEYVFFAGAYAGMASFLSSSSVIVPIPVGSLVAGVPYPLQVLSVTMGIQNWAYNLEQVTRGLVGSVELDGVDLAQEQQQQQWYHQVGLQGEALGLFTPSGAFSPAWNKTASVPLHVDRVWYSFTIETGEIVAPSGGAQFPTFQLYVGGLGKGAVWFNGFHLGRYWDLVAPPDCPPCVWQGVYSADKCRYDCGQQSLDVLHVPLDVLAPEGQPNRVVVWAEQGGDPTTVTLAQRN